jgi:hypothetical protein
LRRSSSAPESDWLLVVNYARREPGGFTSALPVEAQEIVRHWLDDGGYGRALELVALEDPDLGNQ